MTDRESITEISYPSAWFYSVLPPLGVIAAIEYKLRGSNRMAFQALVCAWPLLVWLGLITVPAAARAAVGYSILVIPAVTLCLLRRLQWPVRTPLKTSAWVSVGWGTFLALLIIIGLLAAIAIPAYRDMDIRSHAVDAIFYDAKDATQTVANYYQQHRRFPVSLEQAGYTAPPPTRIKSMQVIDRGTVRVVLGFSPLVGHSVKLVPTVNSDHKITWQCTSIDVPEKYLPIDCRSTSK